MSGFRVGYGWCFAHCACPTAFPAAFGPRRRATRAERPQATGASRLGPIPA